MTYKVVISNTKKTFPLKGLNELLNGRMYNPRTNKYQNPVKRQNDDVCVKAIKKQLRGVVINKPIRCHFHIYAQDKKHDRSNLCSSVSKSFADSLILAGVIKNDTWDLYLDETFCTEICKEFPRIEVLIEEVC